MQHFHIHKFAKWQISMVESINKPFQKRQLTHLATSQSNQWPQRTIFSHLVPRMPEQLYTKTGHPKRSRFAMSPGPHTEHLQHPLYGRCVYLNPALMSSHVCLRDSSPEVQCPSWALQCPTSAGWIGKALKNPPVVSDEASVCTCPVHLLLCTGPYTLLLTLQGALLQLRPWACGQSTG